MKIKKYFSVICASVLAVSTLVLSKTNTIVRAESGEGQVLPTICYNDKAFRTDSDSYIIVNAKKNFTFTINEVTEIIEKKLNLFLDETR